MLKITFHFLLVSMTADENQPSSNGASSKNNQYFLSGCFKKLPIDFGVWSFTMSLNMGFFLFILLGFTGLLNLRVDVFHQFEKDLSHEFLKYAAWFILLHFAPGTLISHILGLLTQFFILFCPFNSVSFCVLCLMLDHFFVIIF